MGNATLWKPSDTAMLSNWTMFKIFREAGVPSGVVNFVPAPGPLFGDTVTDSPDLAGVSFTGSSAWVYNYRVYFYDIFVCVETYSGAFKWTCLQQKACLMQTTLKPQAL